MKTVKLGLLGYGEIGRAHASALQEIAEAELIAIAEPSEAVRCEAAKTSVEVFASHEELLASDAIDAVIVATPDHLHSAPCLDAAKAGKHILVEKPIMPTVEESLVIRDAANEAGIKLMVGHTLRFFPEYQYAEQQVRGGELGELVSVFARRTNIITQPERIAGRVSVLGFLGVHDFDVLRWIVGAEPTRIFCENASSVTHGHGVEDETFTTIKFANGVVACLHCGWFVPENHPAGFDFRLDVTGSKGMVNLDFSNAVTTFHGENGTRQPLMTPALIEENRAFIRSILNDDDVPVSANDGIAAVRMVAAAEQSARSGVPVTLD